MDDRPLHAEGLLTGVRVLEFSQIYAGPLAGVALSDLGAEVVKVEPPEGEPYRQGVGGIAGESKRFRSLNRGKKSLAVDLKHRLGRELIKTLVRGFDVVLINYRPGVDRRLGIDYETLSAEHPALIYCQITGLGTRGPLASRAATDIVATAYSGLLATSERVDEEGTPAFSSPAVADPTTGLAAAMAIAAALYRRQRTGEGQLLSASLLRSALTLQDTAVMYEPSTDRSQREKLRSELTRIRSNGGAYVDLLEARRLALGRATSSAIRLYFRGYRAKDGPLVLGCLTEPTRRAARRALAIVNDPAEQPGDDRSSPEYLRRVDECRDQIASTIRTRTVADWMKVFDSAGVPAAPVQFPEEMVEDPHVIEEGILSHLDHEVMGVQTVVGPIVEASPAQTSASGPAPVLGRHTDELLARAGVDPAFVSQLRDRGVVL